MFRLIINSLLAIGLFFAVSPIVFAALAVDARSQGTAVVSTNTISWSHTVTGSNTSLAVCAVSAEGTPVTASATYNSVSMGASRFNKRDDVDTGEVIGFYMTAPAAGTHTIGITWSGAVDIGTAFAVSFTGADQSGSPIRSVFTRNEADGTGPNITVTDSQNGDIVFDCAKVFASTITVGAGQDSTNTEDDAIAGSGSHSGGASTEAATGSNTVMSWTNVSFYAQGAFSIIPAGAGGGSTVAQKGMLLGVNP